MPLLSIETSSLSGGCAVISSGQVLGETILSTRKTHSRRLISSISGLMKGLDLTWEDLEAVAVGLGPGSFTGLRIGIATAKGLALALSIPVFGVPTLDIIAENVALEDSRLICPVVDARRKQIYTGLYAPDFPKSPKRIKGSCVLDPVSLLEFIPAKDDILFLGDGIISYRKILIQDFKDRAAFAPEHLWHPRPALAGLVAEKRWMEGKVPDDPALLVPLYCRLSEAEEYKRKNVL